MKLPSHILKQVSWFEHYREDIGYFYGDRFVLHFAPWWKPRQTIWINDYVSTGSDPRSMMSESANELLAQLKTQCPDQA